MHYIKYLKFVQLKILGLSQIILLFGGYPVMVGIMEFVLGQWLMTSGINGMINMYIKGNETSMTYEANISLNTSICAVMKVTYVAIFKMMYNWWALAWSMYENWQP